MDLRTVNEAFGVGAFVANFFTVVIVAGFIFTRLSNERRAAWVRMREALSPLALAGAWVVGTICTCASLYLQFGEHLIPCDLCWFQRVAMYPQALILGVATFSRDFSLVKRYMIPLAAIGAAISLLHIDLPAIQQALGISQLPGCTLDASCTVQPITEFGFVTVPYMALSGFTLIIALLLLLRDREY